MRQNTQNGTYITIRILKPTKEHITANKEHIMSAAGQISRFSELFEFRNC
jgi:hypothetical protein